MLHGATFVVYVLLTLHGFGAGTDTPVLTGMYGSSVLLIVFLTTYRVLQSKAAARPGAETDAATQVTSAGGDTRSSRSLAAGSR